MAAYSPFGRELKDLEAGDLAALRDAAEGWYIEYKREMPTAAASIAKSISAFANTYGGWLFYGIAEKSKEDAVAGSFPGIPRDGVDAALQRMRQAAAGLVNPSPHFDSKVVWGPNELIGLAEDRAIICVHVRWSPVAPHVHKSGHIYRRIADGSEPKAENDRFVLDQLWRRSEDIQKHYRDLVDRDPELSKGEEERPFVRLLLVADLWQDRGPRANISLEEFRAVLGQTQGLISGIPFDTIYPSVNGFVGRQIQGNDPHNLGLTWRFGQSLISEVIVPLDIHFTGHFAGLSNYLHGYYGAERFVQALLKQGHKSPKVIDLNYLFSALIGITEIQQRLMARAGWCHGFFVKARLLNVWRTIPFVDVPLILTGFERHGIPMCLDQFVTSPSGTHPQTFVKVSEFSEIENESNRLLTQSFVMFGPIARAFGLPAWIEPDPEGDTPAYDQQLLRAGGRAMEVQHLRAERSRGR
jgi:hypothetical protein